MYFKIFVLLFAFSFYSSVFENSRALKNYDLQVSANGHITYYVPATNSLNPIAIIDNLDGGSDYSASFYLRSWSLSNIKMKIVKATVDQSFLGTAIDSNIKITSIVQKIL